MKNGTRWALVGALSLALGACGGPKEPESPDDGPIEEAGEEIDEAAADVEKGAEEAVDETGDAIGDVGDDIDEGTEDVE